MLAAQRFRSNEIYFFKCMNDHFFSGYTWIKIGHFRANLSITVLWLCICGLNEYELCVILIQRACEDCHATCWHVLDLDSEDTCAECSANNIYFIHTSSPPYHCYINKLYVIQFSIFKMVHTLSPSFVSEKAYYHHWSVAAASNTHVYKINKDYRSFFIICSSSISVGRKKNTTRQFWHWHQ